MMLTKIFKIEHKGNTYYGYFDSYWFYEKAGARGVYFGVVDHTFHQHPLGYSRTNWILAWKAYDKEVRNEN